MSDNDQNNINGRNYVRELEARLKGSPFTVSEYNSGVVGIHVHENDSLRPDKIFWPHVADAVNKVLGQDIVTGTVDKGEPGLSGVGGMIAALAEPMIVAGGSGAIKPSLQLTIDAAALPALLDHPNFPEVQKILKDPYRETAARTEGFTGARLKAAAVLLESKDEGIRR